MSVDQQQTEAVDALKKLVEDEKDLYIGNPTDKRLLLQFLRFTDFNIEEAFEKMKQWFKLKATNSDFYAFKRDPKVHDEILKKGAHVILDNRDQLGRRMYLFKLGNLVYGAHEPHEMFQVDDLWIGLALEEEETQKNGLIFLFDMENFSWKFLRYFTPHIIRASTSKAESIPVRNVQYHVINAGRFLNIIIQLIFPFLSQATKDVVYFHKTKESLHAHIAASELPVEYGGARPSPDPEVLVRAYMDHRNDRLNELLSYCYKSNPEDVTKVK